MHVEDQAALQQASKDVAALSADLQRQRDAHGQLQAEEARLRAALADTQGALDEHVGRAREQAAALEAALRLEEAARRDAERLLESERAAAERREAQEADRLAQEQVGVSWRNGTMAFRYEIFQCSPELHPSGHVLCVHWESINGLVALESVSHWLKRRSGNRTAQLPSHGASGQCQL